MEKNFNSNGMVNNNFNQNGNAANQAQPQQQVNNNNTNPSSVGKYDIGSYSSLGGNTPTAASNGSGFTGFLKNHKKTIGYTTGGVILAGGSIYLGKKIYDHFKNKDSKKTPTEPAPKPQEEKKPEDKKPDEKGFEAVK